jgi:hypothetical protein
MGDMTNDEEVIGAIQVWHMVVIIAEAIELWTYRLGCKA